MNSQIKKMIDQSIETHTQVHELSNDIEKATKVMISSLKKGNKIMICGNGGSAAQAQHFTAELIGRFEADRKPIPCISLTTDTSNLTAIGNDFDFDLIYKKQVEALAKPGDILICLSTSGNSRNLIEAANKIRNITVINLLGRGGGKMKDTGDINIIINSQNSARIQECHILILHIFAKLIELSYI